MILPIVIVIGLFYFFGLWALPIMFLFNILHDAIFGYFR
jgi:hypothetical protein